jgi:hypothetical protein
MEVSRMAREQHDDTALAARDGVGVEYGLYAAAVRRARSLGADIAPRYLPGSPCPCNAAEAVLAVRLAAARGGPVAGLLTYQAQRIEHLAADLALALEDQLGARLERAHLGLER